MTGRDWLTLLTAGFANGLVVAALDARQWHPVWIGLISCAAVGVVFYVMDRINRRTTR